MSFLRGFSIKATWPVQSKVTSLEKGLARRRWNKQLYRGEYESKFAKPVKEQGYPICEHSAIVQPIYNAIIREVTNAGWK